MREYNIGTHKAINDVYKTLQRLKPLGDEVKMSKSLKKTKETGEVIAFFDDGNIIVKVFIFQEGLLPGYNIKIRYLQKEKAHPVKAWMVLREIWHYGASKFPELKAIQPENGYVVSFVWEFL